MKNLLADRPTEESSIGLYVYVHLVMWQTFRPTVSIF